MTLTPKTGCSWALVIGGVTYKCTESIADIFKPRLIPARGSGDVASCDVAAGLDDSETQVSVISNDYALKSYKGVVVTGCKVMDGATTVYSSFTAMINAQATANLNGLVVWNVGIKPHGDQGLPSELSYLALS